ncbi:MAG: 1,4-alpha-glucan branching protein domain-containing protein [Solirubrobacteraceae bacterium]
MSPRPASGGQGELAIVLHTHMPYVEGFGSWPFGEEWLWEAIATCYLPLLDVLGRAPITVSLTPVLCDQLESSSAMQRCLRFLREIRPASHALDIEQARAGAGARAIAELERSAAEYATAADRLERLQRDGGLLNALGEHATWTSSATHAILPLLVTDAAIALQMKTGIASHRGRFGEWEGGFWLPECAYATWLNVPLEQAGVNATCVELTSHFGVGDRRNLRPLLTDEGPLLWPVDRQIMDLPWGNDGYPSRPAYRDRLALTPRHHHVLSNDGTPYDHARALEQAALDAREFVQRAARRVAGGGVCVCALDTELLGHWWYEGVQWLACVISEAERQRLPMATLQDARERHEPASAGEDLPVTSWGIGNDLRTWSGPASAAFAWQIRRAELDVLSAPARPSERVLRELLALQASDWAFLHSYGWSADYPRERADGHAAELYRALGVDPPAAAFRATAGAGGAPMDQTLRNLAPRLTGWEG